MVKPVLLDDPLAPLIPAQSVARYCSPYSLEGNSIVLRRAMFIQHYSISDVEEENSKLIWYQGTKYCD